MEILTIEDDLIYIQIIIFFLISKWSSLKTKGCTQVHKNYTREIPNQKTKQNLEIKINKKLNKKKTWKL